MKPIILALLLSGCSVASYTRTDGVNTVSVWGFEVGTDRALSGFRYKSDKAELAIDDTQALQSKGMESIIAGVIKGVSLAVKP